MNVNFCDHADVANTKALLAALKTAVESYLGTNICFAELGLFDVKGYATGVAQEALQPIGLRQALPALPAGKMAVYANMGDAMPEYDDEPWIILAVDYSFHWINLGLYTMDDDGLVDVIKEEHHPYISSFTGPKTGRSTQLSALKDALHNLLSKPSPDVALPVQIRHLVVYGDEPKNNALHHLLTTVPDPDLVPKAHLSSSLFDGVTVVAKSSLEYMDRIDFIKYARTAFGCRWRPELYGDGHDEL